ncbi:MAG: S1C family serine protease [Planctomycetota bacterium]
MRGALLPLALAAAVSVTAAQTPTAAERARRAVVRVEAVEPAFERVSLLVRQRAPVEELRRVKIQQPYRLVTSGVVISSRGEILTTALHPRAKLRIRVFYRDGSVDEARMVGTDPLSNLALVSVDRPVSAYLELAQREAAEAEVVEILGDGALQDITQVGSVARRQVTVYVPDLYGVTRRAFLPLPSAFAVMAMAGSTGPGCPCLDRDGRLSGLLIGRSKPRLRRRRGPGGEKVSQVEVCFALPASRLQRVVRDLRQKGRVVRARFGVRLRVVPPALRAQFDLPASAAAVVALQPGGPAHRHGLLVHDVIVSLDGRTYSGFHQLAEGLSDSTPKRPARLRVLRKGKPLELTVVPEEMR